ncbi:MAG: hypothetical protein F6J97_20525 [Leptolyngbya sp. SIO4C1]|nr:hypothetical protein [Leptolyngbya sp. SIO4C1]
MNSYTNASARLDLQRQQLEQSWELTPRPTLRDRIAERLAAIGQWMLTLLTEGNRLQISYRETAQGSLWEAYDPLSQQHRLFDSEAELRVWLEQRYYK